MSLLSLPTEILQGIIGYLIPESYERIALACKNTHYASLCYRKDYNARRKRFRHFSYDLEPESEGGNGHDQGSSTRRHAHYAPICNAHDLLQVMAESPSIGRYIRTADFSGDNLGVISSDEHFGITELRPPPPYLHGDQTTLLKLLRSSPYIPAAHSSPEKWLEGMTTERLGHSDMFLLTLLPNVRRLTVSPRHASRYVGEHVDHLVSEIVRCANNPTWNQSSLEKLLHITIKDTGGVGSLFDTANFARWVLPLVTILPVQSLHAGSVAIEDLRHLPPYLLMYGLENGCFSEIKLNNSSLDAGCLGVILRHTPCLERFHLTWAEQQGYTVGDDADFNPGGLLSTLQENVGNTLQKLVIVESDTIYSPPATLTDMRSFEQLEILDITIFAFLGPELDPTDVDNMKEGCPPALPCFRDMLPMSLEIVRLYVATWRPELIVDCLNALFAFSPQERGEYLPDWREFALIKTGEPCDEIDECAERLKAAWDNEPTFSFTIRSMGPGETIDSISSEGRPNRLMDESDGSENDGSYRSDYI